jgi:diguanylate cyclase (GGDEF)-like protein/PAS domain S-box-containing protein
MKSEKNQPDEADELRRRAEKKVSEKASWSSENLEALSSKDIQRLVHDLRVHQIELELQNEELRRRQTERETAWERYSDFFDIAPVGFVTLSEQGLILEANLTIARLLGLPRGELIQRPFPSFIFREDADIHFLRQRKLIATGEPQAYDLRMLKNDGTGFWVHLVTSAVLDADGTQVYQIVLTDLTEAKKVEDALRETQTILKAALDNSQVGIAIADAPSGALRYVNDAGLLIRGSNRESVVNGVGIDQYVASWQILDFDGRPLNSDEVPLTRAVLFGETCSREFIIRRTREDDRIVVANAAPIRDENEKIVAGIVVFLDITERKGTEQTLRLSELDLKEAQSIAHIGSWKWDIHSGEVSWSDEMFRIFGIDKNSHTGRLGNVAQKAMHPDDLYIVMPDNAVNIANAPFEYRIIRPDGTIRLIRAKAANTIFGQNAKPIFMVGIAQDITESRLAEDALREANAYLENLVNYANAPIIVWDPQFRITRFNHAFEFLTGRSEAEVLGQSLEILFPPALSGNAMAQIHKTRTGERWETVEIEILHRDGSPRTVLWNSATLFTPDGQMPIATIAQGHNITARKEAEENVRVLNIELERLSLTDYLTHLFNRRYFMQHGVEEFKRAQRYHQPLALIMLDIDEFKKVNDTYGHEAGDSALQQVAQVLKSSVREIDILGRLGGDEFVVLLPNTAQPDAALLGERIRQSIANSHFSTPGDGLIRSITVSVGVAAYSDEMSGINDLLRNADAALYQAKNNGRNSVGIYQENTISPNG